MSDAPKLAVVKEIRKPSDAVVSSVRDLSEKVDRGEVVAFVVACQFADGSIGTALALGEHYDLFRLSGAASFLTHRLNTRMEQP